MKVKPLEQWTVNAARWALEKEGVSCESDLHDIVSRVAKHDLFVQYVPATTLRAVIVRSTTHGIVCVDERARGEPWERFPIAHELGHLLMHLLVDHHLQCTEESYERTGTMYRREREANHFATEHTIPEQYGAPHCRHARPTLDDVDRFARRFRATMEMAMIRYVQLASAPCAAVRVVDGRVRWAAETQSFPGRIVHRRLVHPESVAASMAKRRWKTASAPREVPGATWGAKKKSKVAFVEHAFEVVNGVGTLCWIVPAA